jgi:hypothetical protein
MSYAAVAAANALPTNSTTVTMPFFHHDNTIHGAAAALTQNPHYPPAHYQMGQYPYLNYHHHHTAQYPTASHQRQTFAIHDLLGLSNVSNSASLTAQNDSLFPT